MENKLRQKILNILFEYPFQPAEKGTEKGVNWITIDKLEELIIQKEQLLVENASLDEEIEKAKRSEGFIIMVSRLNSDKLNHYWHTWKFPRKHILFALFHFNQSLKREMGATIAEEPKVPDNERQLPPEYRSELPKTLDNNLEK